MISVLQVIDGVDKDISDIFLADLDAGSKSHFDACQRLAIDSRKCGLDVDGISDT